MTPAGIAIYNAILCVTLALGAGWLPHYLSLYFSIERAVIMAMLATAISFGLLVIFPSRIIAFLLFGIVGLTISTANTNIVIQVSNSADSSIQGEAMGAQLSLRILGDAVICLVGGVLIISSVTLPIALSCVIAVAAAGIYATRYLKAGPIVPDP